MRVAQVWGLGSGSVGRERTQRTQRGPPRRTSANGYLTPALRLHIFRFALCSLRSFAAIPPLPQKSGGGDARRQLGGGHGLAEAPDVAAHGRGTGGAPRGGAAAEECGEPSGADHPRGVEAIGQSMVLPNGPPRLPAAWPLDPRVTVRPPSFPPPPLPFPSFPLGSEKSNGTVSPSPARAILPPMRDSFAPPPSSSPRSLAGSPAQAPTEPARTAPTPANPPHLRDANQAKPRKTKPASLVWYAPAREHRPAWMRVDRLLGEHGIAKHHARGREQFERRSAPSPVAAAIPLPKALRLVVRDGGSAHSMACWLTITSRSRKTLRAKVCSSSIRAAVPMRWIIWPWAPMSMRW